jgi:hypothetical protein
MTIKEAAASGVENPVILSQGYKLTAYISFIAGAKFAQRWISVIEDLPITDEEILLQYEGGRIDIGHYAPKVGSFYSVNQSAPPRFAVTHWRRIEAI